MTLKYAILRNHAEIYDQIKIPFFYSPYDCTGQRFTAGIDFYKVHNGTWIYHRIGVDV